MSDFLFQFTINAVKRTQDKGPCRQYADMEPEIAYGVKDEYVRKKKQHEYHRGLFRASHGMIKMRIKTADVHDVILLSDY